MTIFHFLCTVYHILVCVCPPVFHFIFVLVPAAVSGDLLCHSLKGLVRAVTFTLSFLHTLLSLLAMLWYAPSLLLAPLPTPSPHHTPCRSS